MRKETPCDGLRRVLPAIDSVPESEDRCLDTVLQAKFGKDVADVSLDCLLTDLQVPRDLAVAVTAGDQLEDLALARRQRL
jgi:hypothetical protein